MVDPSLEGDRIIFSDEALKQLHKLDKHLAQQIIKKVKKLNSGAEYLNIKKLKSQKYDLYRLRVGDFRVIYSIAHEQIKIYIVALGYRKDIYKKMSH